MSIWAKETKETLDKVCQVLKCKQEDLGALRSGNKHSWLINFYSFYQTRYKEYTFAHKPDTVCLFETPNSSFCTANIQYHTDRPDSATFLFREKERARLIEDCYRFKKETWRKFDKPILPKDQFQTIITDTEQYLKRVKLLTKMKVKMPRGILLMGPPGTGKSMICGYFEARYNTSVVTASGFKDFVKNRDKIYPGEVIIYDDFEFEWLNSRTSEEANGLLALIDGPKKANAVHVLTTNCIDEKFEIAPEFIRPGRFSNIVQLKMPNEDLRKEFISKWNVTTPLDADFLLAKTKDRSYAEMDAIRQKIILRELDGLSIDLPQIVDEVEEARRESRRGKMGLIQTEASNVK